MNVCMVGLGKLGLPVSLAMCSQQVTVYGYEVDEQKVAQYKRGVSGLHEPDIDQELRMHYGSGRLHLCSGDELDHALCNASIVFVAVPTPSDYETDAFELGIVREALEAIATSPAMSDGAYRTIALISTVLPTTCRRMLESEIRPHLTEAQAGFCYNAQFIAMGTVKHDFLHPEFVLVGEDTKRAGADLESFYRYMLPRASTPVLRMPLASAELVKMGYNTMIGLKIVFANTIMEICDKIEGCDVDTVTGALSRATDRLISAKYLTGGLGDGGGCHPRDQRALGFMARELALAANPFHFVSYARNTQTAYIAEVVHWYAERTGLPIVVLGSTFKPGTNLETDSPALLLAEALSDDFEIEIPVIVYDPITRADVEIPDPAVYVIGTRHEIFQSLHCLPGSVIVDPWRWYDEHNLDQGVQYIPIGACGRGVRYGPV